MSGLTASWEKFFLGVRLKISISPGLTLLSVSRATGSETNLCVFDGGLSIQEYDASDPSEICNLSSEMLLTEYMRGEGLGGGVGGMVYSIRDSNRIYSQKKGSARKRGQPVNCSISE